MNPAAAQIVARARMLIGTRFRPQGRDPSTGLDCVGVILRAFEIEPSEVRRNYRIRGQHLREIHSEASRRLARISVEQRQPGDLLCFELADDQLHLGVECGTSFIHADAGLRRVVETPGPARWPLVGVFRRHSSAAKSV